MSKHKKTNPRRIPVSLAEVKRAKAEAQSVAVDTSCAMTLMVLHDKFGFGKQRLTKYWEELNYLADSITKGYVKCPDLDQVLLEECGIKLVRGAVSE